MTTEATSTEDSPVPTIAFLTMIGLMGGFILGCAITHWSSSGYINTLERMTQHYKGKFEYYFDGANKRDYIELCRDAAGEIDVLFRDECAPE